MDDIGQAKNTGSGVERPRERLLPRNVNDLLLQSLWSHLEGVELMGTRRRRRRRRSQKKKK